jgi:hypothetical protein
MNPTGHYERGGVDMVGNYRWLLLSPERTEHEPQDGHHRKRHHWLVFEGLVGSSLKVPSNFLSFLGCFTTLLGHTPGELLRLVRDIAERIGGLISELPELIGRLILEAMDGGASLVATRVGLGWHCGSPCKVKRVSQSFSGIFVCSVRPFSQVFHTFYNWSFARNWRPSSSRFL